MSSEAGGDGADDVLSEADVGGAIVGSTLEVVVVASSLLTASEVGDTKEDVSLLGSVVDQELTDTVVVDVVMVVVTSSYASETPLVVLP